MTSLLSSVKVADLNLSHRVVMAPLTRSRAELPGGVPGSLMLEYYTQRTSEGGLIIGEGTSISRGARGWLGAPGLYSDDQVSGWRKITDAVHAKGGFMFAQLWHTGRSSHISVTEGIDPVSASVTPAYWQDASNLTSTPKGWLQPSPHRALATSEIAAVVDEYRAAAACAKDAGFDGVELHGANGYLPDQFLQDGSNKRTDAYGGSIENRTRFTLEVLDAMVSVWGSNRVSLRIGPDGHWNSMFDSDPSALFTYLVQPLNDRALAYLHIIEPRVRGNVVVAEGQAPIAAEQLRKIFKGPIIAAGGFEPASAEAIIQQGTADLVAFGRYFVSNPDLVNRVRHQFPLSYYDRDTFYTFDALGYIDYLAYDKRAVAA